LLLKGNLVLEFILFAFPRFDFLMVKNKKLESFFLSIFILSCNDNKETSDNTQIIEFDFIQTPARFEIPTTYDTISFTVFVKGDSNYYFSIFNIVAPDGAILLDEKFSGINPVLPSKSVFVALIPDSDFKEVKIQKGNYHFDLISFDDEGVLIPSNASVKVVLKSGTLNFDEKRLLDFDFFIAEGAKEGLSAESAENDDEIIACLDRFSYYFTLQANIETGKINFQNINSKYAIIESEEELGEMFSLSVNSVGSGIAVFFVGSLSGISDEPRGRSGGIPGSPFHGDSNSGIVIAVGGDPAETSDSFCHEIGHYLGLFHTSDTFSDGTTIHDPISDTPECILKTTQDISSCPARTNLMFPQANGLRNEITGGQAYVCRLSPLLRRKDDY